MSEHILPSEVYCQRHFILGNSDGVFCGAANLWSHSAAKAAEDLGADPSKAA